MIQRPEPTVIKAEIVILGAGPTGLTAAEILNAAKKDVWVLGSPYESQAAKAGPIQNVTNVPENTIGLDYMEEWINKAKANGVKHKGSLCTGIEIQDKILVKTKYQHFLTEKIIIATGAKQGKLNFKGETDFLHKGISDCAVCDWGLFRGKNVAVIGNHQYTQRAAEFLKDHMETVNLIWYESSTNFTDEKISIYNNANNLEASGSDVLERIRFDSGGKNYELEVSAIFVEGKPIPSTDFLVESGIELKNQFIVVNEKLETNIKGIWAAGDVTGQSSSFDAAIEQGKLAAKQILDSL